MNPATIGITSSAKRAEMKKTLDSMVILIPGIVFIIMGFAYSNPGIWILGVIFLALGLFLKYKKK